jgi:serine/threonine-protein kinase RsbW
MNDTPMTQAPDEARSRPTGDVPRETPTRKDWLGCAAPGVLRYVFPGLPEHVHEARTLVKDAFTGTDREDDAALIVGELASNAIFYTRSGREGGWFGVELSFGSLVRIAVADLGGAGWLIGEAASTNDPERQACSEPRALIDRHADEQELSLDDIFSDFDIPGLEGISLGGRGLALVANLAVITGAQGSPVIGHTVWADLQVTCPAHPFPEAVTA